MSLFGKSLLPGATPRRGNFSNFVKNNIMKDSSNTNIMEFFQMIIDEEKG